MFLQLFRVEQTVARQEEKSIEGKVQYMGIETRVCLGSVFEKQCNLRRLAAFVAEDFRQQREELRSFRKIHIWSGTYVSERDMRAYQDDRFVLLSSDNFKITENHIRL